MHESCEECTEKNRDHNNAKLWKKLFHVPCYKKTQKHKQNLEVVCMEQLTCQKQNDNSKVFNGLAESQNQVIFSLKRSW